MKTVWLMLLLCVVAFFATEVFGTKTTTGTSRRKRKQSLLAQQTILGFLTQASTGGSLLDDDHEFHEHEEPEEDPEVYDLHAVLPQARKRRRYRTQRERAGKQNLSLVKV